MFFRNRKAFVSTATIRAAASAMRGAPASGLIAPATMRVVLTAILMATALAGCGRSQAREEREVDPSLVRLDTERLILRHDRIGHDQWESQATFALVDAHNEHSQDLLVTLGGDFVDKEGRAVGTIVPESLRIPAGGVRTFAMVDKERAERPEATGVRLRVLGAYVPNYVPPVQVTDGAVYQDGDRAVVNAMVRNAVDQPVRVLVLAGFYDREGRPIRRPFTEMYLPGDGSHPAQFVGPPGSVQGYIFIGDMVY